jgi:hypothetical protein
MSHESTQTPTPEQQNNIRTQHLQTAELLGGGAMFLASEHNHATGTEGDGPLVLKATGEQVDKAREAMRNAKTDEFLKSNPLGQRIAASDMQISEFIGTIGTNYFGYAGHRLVKSEAEHAAKQAEFTGMVERFQKVTDVDMQKLNDGDTEYFDNLRQRLGTFSANHHAIATVLANDRPDLLGSITVARNIYDEARKSTGMQFLEAGWRIQGINASGESLTVVKDNSRNNEHKPFHLDELIALNPVAVPVSSAEHVAESLRV